MSTQTTPALKRIGRFVVQLADIQSNKCPVLHKSMSVVMSRWIGKRPVEGERPDPTKPRQGHVEYICECPLFALVPPTPLIEVPLYNVELNGGQLVISPVSPESIPA